MLANEGYETKAAYSGTEAIEAAKDFRPDVLITDLVMPDMSGTKLRPKSPRSFPTSR